MKNSREMILEINWQFASLIENRTNVEASIPFANGNFDSNLEIIQGDIAGIIKYWTEDSFYNLRAELFRLTGLCSIGGFSKKVLQNMFSSLSQLYHPDHSINWNIRLVLMCRILSDQKSSIPDECLLSKDEDSILNHLFANDFTLNKNKLNGWGLSKKYLSIYNALEEKRHNEINADIVNIANYWISEYESINRYQIEFNQNHTFPFELDANSLYCLVKRKGIELDIPKKYSPFYLLGEMMD